jgi:dolichol-phosphate mannosyltransferase
MRASCGRYFNNGERVKLSVVIPAHNEEGCIVSTVRNLYMVLAREQIANEILVIDDNSTDQTAALLQTLKTEVPTLKVVHNDPPNGFGLAVRRGLEVFTGGAVAVYMADASDTPEDLVRFFRIMESKHVDCVFGSRFMPGSTLIDYPWPKRILNRLGNRFIQMLFQLRYNDVTNAFKLYRRHTVMGLKPFLSHHFNMTIEMPLKAIVRGYSYTVVPNQWINRETGVSKLRIKEMGSRYLFIVFYCFIEKWLTRGDYHRKYSKGIENPAVAQEELVERPR